MTEPSTPLEVAERYWGKPLPDWVEVLARMSTESTQGAAARAIGYSAGIVSTVLRNQYRADLARVEAAVRGALMAETVRCPVLAEDITLDHCARSQSHRGHDPLSEAFAQLCPACPNSWAARNKARKAPDDQLKMEV